MGLPTRVVVPIIVVFAVIFLGIMGYFLRIGFGTTGSAFGPGAKVHEQGDAQIAATPVPDTAPTQPSGTLDIPQSGTGPVAANGAGAAGTDGGAAPEANAGGATGAGGPPPGAGGPPPGAGGPPAPVMQLLGQLKARVRDNPRDIAAIVELGNLYFDAQKFGQSAAYYRQALALDPTNPDVRNDEAAALHASGDDLRALREVDRVLAERPSFPQALFNRGIILRAMGRRSDAAAAYREFIAAAPHDPHDADAREAIKELSQ